MSGPNSERSLLLDFFHYLEAGPHSEKNATIRLFFTIWGPNSKKSLLLDFFSLFEIFWK